MRVLAVSGSLQAQSGNLALLQRAVELAPAGMTLEIFDGLRALPHFNPDLEVEYAPREVQAWRLALAASDALLIASPEYGRSLPGSLKNGVDWTIGSGELYRRIVAMTAAVPGADRGRPGLVALGVTLSAVGCEIVWSDPIARTSTFDQDIARMLSALAQAVRVRREALAAEREA
jgi:NAD(P)H-dependent FMN reductase